jgi:hypothetical protein
MDRNEDYQKHIALVFSIIFPGAGLIYQKKWFSGIAYGLIHLLIIGLLFNRAIETTYYRLAQASRGSTDVGMLIFLGMCLLANWFANIRTTQNYA